MPDLTLLTGEEREIITAKVVDAGTVIPALLTTIIALRQRVAELEAERMCSAGVNDTPPKESDHAAR